MEGLSNQTNGWKGVHCIAFIGSDAFLYGVLGGVGGREKLCFSLLQYSTVFISHSVTAKLQIIFHHGLHFFSFLDSARCAV
jgi:hypothetical protein